jgi:uncharacterized protein DUF6702
MLGLILGFALLLPPPPAPTPIPVAHPLHTALAELTYRADSQTMVIRIRVFADDLAGAVSGLTEGDPPDSALSRYARGTFALADRSGRPVPLRWEGADHAGDLVLLRLGAALGGGLAGVRVLAALLWERFPDQINIVRASYGGRTTTLLFTRGDTARQLP